MGGLQMLIHISCIISFNKEILKKATSFIHFGLIYFKVYEH